ncbi:alpha/beta hydrolase [Bizionia gelidisalsuginis]|uniref:Alpha/beta hydrolase n=2 Tax=Bizionia TaxID=283785 RepID=A0A8H2LEF8_9FLAO|nr:MULTISPECIES: alpha/beta hydrolase [Bizionia]TYB73834.1 alpha/beta hydrolase [Bizionia saleffrena]TYC12797.1 alpha/beta hydrolase [Bizionia gelidisalsuginis]
MSKTLIKIIGNALNAASYASQNYATSKAWSLFITPRKGRVKDTQQPFLNTAVQQTITHDALKIATYHWQGSKKTILLVHGWESNTHRWEKLITELQALDYNIVALDAPAHGKTSGKHFNAILYAECIHKVTTIYHPEIIIGHSVGGMASVFYQYQHQNKAVEKLILLGAPSEFTGVFERYVAMLGYNKRIEKGLNDRVFSTFNKTPDYFSLAQFVKEISTDTLLIHDKNDQIIPYSDAKLIIKNLEKGRLITTEGFGHSLRKKEINSHIIKFITH